MRQIYIGVPELWSDKQVDRQTAIITLYIQHTKNTKKIQNCANGEIIIVVIMKYKPKIGLIESEIVDRFWYWSQCWKSDYDESVDPYFPFD